MLSLNYPYITKDGTKLYLAKLVKDLAKDYKGNKNWIYRSRHFLEVVLMKGLYYRHKGKGYTIEVIITEKLPPDGSKGRLR